MYETKDEHLLSRAAFLKRVIVHVLAACVLAVVMLLFGVVGHLMFDDMSLHDALVNTAFVLGGVGAFIVPSTVAGKIFVASYGLLTNLFFVASIGVILAPIAHRLLHKFHLDQDD